MPSVYERARRVDQAIAFIQSHWDHFRLLAETAFHSHGRGTFVFDITREWEEYLEPTTPIVYLTARNAANLSNGISAWMLSGDVEAYDVGRQVVFTFWWPNESDSMTRTLSEWPNGTPRLTPDKRWAYAPRRCPECRMEFKSIGDFGACPQCNHAFVASQAEYDAANHPVVLPIAEEPPQASR